MARTRTGRPNERIHTRRLRIYKDRYLKEISFPLGGIGTGCIGLAGNGRLIDWEIFNRPNKGSVNGFSHFAIKAESEGELLDARVLHGDLHPPYTGSHVGCGFGPMREYLVGLPHFKHVAFLGEFPFAQLLFKGNAFPGSIRMTAFNPFIPLNDKDSGLPAAFFDVEVKNTHTKPILYTIAGTLTNPLPGNNCHTVTNADHVTSLFLTSDMYRPEEIGYGDLSIATDAEDVSWQQYWFRGNWFDSLEIYWKDFIAPGKLKNRIYPPDRAGAYNHGMLAAHILVQPGRKEHVRFVISWNFPHCQNYWDPHAPDLARKADVPLTWKNYYALLWKDSKQSAGYALENWARLYEETLLFKHALFGSDVPPAALEAISANISIIKTPTVQRLEDGTFYGWEGCFSNAGCCEGSCTHVWNYGQALPFLFPKLERSMRDADYAYNQQANGGMPFRLKLPLGIKHPGGSAVAGEDQGGRSCADGLLGGVLKVYRDWKISGDTKWLTKIWPAVRKSIEYAWDQTNEDAWDTHKTGVLWGRQHHTLDMELFGPNAWLTGFYLGALKAGAEMAEHLGETSTAAAYREVFEKGKAWVDKHLFNGEYYYQRIDLKDKSIPARFNALVDYWDAEHEEIKYQIGLGCGIDQVLAQWHANLYGLGEIFDPEQTRKALQAIFTYNYKRSMRDFCNPCRIYALNEEQGLVMCEWPKKSSRPSIPLTYAQETMNGFEYAAAAHMIQNRMIKEGMSIVKAVRDRYDGEKRNPWNEFECGSNYARSMASYALLNAFSGFAFDMVKGMLGFHPVRPRKGRFTCFWSLDSGWGEFHMKPGYFEVRVLYGHVRLQTMKLPFRAQEKAINVTHQTKHLGFTQKGREILLSQEACLVKGQSLRIYTKHAARTLPGGSGDEL